MAEFKRSWGDVIADSLRKLLPREKTEGGKKKKETEDALIIIPSVSDALTGTIDRVKQKKDKKENKNAFGGS